MTTSMARFVLCAATILASCSRPSQSPTAPSASSPTQLGALPLAVLVDGQHGATAIAGVSEVTVDAIVAGDTKLRYQADYGDGNSSTQASSKHVYANAGTFHVTVTLTDAAGRTTSAAQDVSVAVVTGAWFQFGVNEGIHRFEARRLSLDQDGTQVRGAYVAYGEPDRRITGQLTANRRITLMTDDGAVKLDGMLPLALTDAGYPVTLTPLEGTTGPLRFDPVPRDPPPPPPNAELRVQTGIAGLDAYYHVPIVFAGLEATFDATRSTGDGLSFVIDFGDGTFANTAVTRHVVLDLIQGRSVRALVVDRFGRVDSETVSLDVWGIITFGGDTFLSGPHVTDGGPRRRLYFQRQNGTQLTGYYQHPEGWTTPLTATLSGANHIHIRLDDGTIDMDGTVTFQGPEYPYSQVWLILSMRGGSADGTVVPFVFVSAY